jgi:hypothetical protein
MKKSFFILMFVAAAVFIISCSKEGPTGPQGEQGIQGVQGAQGLQGIQGVPGADGNANVHSYSYEVYSDVWGQVNPYYGVDLLVPEITQSILDEGAVLVYMANGYGGYIYLPFVEWKSSYSTVTYPIISLGVVTIWVYDSDLTQTYNPGYSVFKVVVIGGSANSAMPSNIDLKNYNSVANYLNIK